MLLLPPPPPLPPPNPAEPPEDPPVRRRRIPAVAAADPRGAIPTGGGRVLAEEDVVCDCDEPLAIVEQYGEFEKGVWRESVCRE